MNEKDVKKRMIFSGLALGPTHVTFDSETYGRRIPLLDIKHEIKNGARITFLIHRKRWVWCGRTALPDRMPDVTRTFGGPRRRIGFDDILSRLMAHHHGPKPERMPTHASPFHRGIQIIPDGKLYPHDVEWVIEPDGFDADLVLVGMHPLFPMMLQLSSGKRLYHVLPDDVAKVMRRMVRGRLSGHFQFVTRKCRNGIALVGPRRKRIRRPRMDPDDFEWDDE